MALHLHPGNEPAAFPPLEVACDVCEGKGRVPNNFVRDVTDECPNCDGRGKLVTEFGDAVIDLVIRRVSLTGYTQLKRK